MAITVQSICTYLDQFAPRRLAEDWDNVGLLVGKRSAPVARVMTCLTITPASAAEAIRDRADLIVAHHPLPFRPLKSITDDTTTGRLLLDLIAADTAVVSPHTAFDSAHQGINQMWAEALELRDIAPLNLLTAATATNAPQASSQAGSPQSSSPQSSSPQSSSPQSSSPQSSSPQSSSPQSSSPQAAPSSSAAVEGSGRWGRWESPRLLADVARQVRDFTGLSGLHRVGPADKPISKAAVACGSAGQFLGAARRLGCDLLITGETNFHTCLEAEATEVALLLPGHFASERFAVERLADHLQGQFPELTFWASRDERDPLSWIS